MNRTAFRVIMFVLIMLAVLTATWLFGATKPDSRYSIVEGHYADGIYTGIGKGFRPGLKVEVEIKQGKVVRIEVISHNEVGRRFWKLPLDLIPKAIIKTQSTRVDAVGGATYTSRGIMAAVENALKKATKQPAS